MINQQVHYEKRRLKILSKTQGRLIISGRLQYRRLGCFFRRNKGSL